MGARNRVGIELLCRPARQHGLAESIAWNRFLAPSTSTNSGSGYICWRYQFLGIDSWAA
jgi:hypothetical protein